jgi:hypothetical protein
MVRLSRIECLLTRSTVTLLNIELLRSPFSGGNAGELWELLSFLSLKWLTRSGPSGQLQSQASHGATDLHLRVSLASQYL